MPQVQSVTYVSQAQASALFKQAFSNDQSYVSTVKETDMPPSFEVKLKNPSGRLQHRGERGHRRARAWTRSSTR